ncbi:MAG: leucine-rich repeat protein [Clostridia bacterium]|nr:leucine-rich repeat protein [Clostridia bacterium]
MIILLIFTLIFLAFPLCASAEAYEEFTDTSGVSDKIFFGIWDSVSQKWTTQPQLNYDGYPGLSAVEEAAKSGDYTAAKEELLAYYRLRSGIAYPSSPNTASSVNTNFWSMRDSLAFTDKYLTDIDIDSTEFKEYIIDLGTNANSGRFLLSSLQKSQSIIEIASRESENPPKLVIELTDGDTVTLTPEKDTYIRAGAYKTYNYGSETSLFVKDDYTYSGGKYLPYSDNSRRSYVFFDNDQIPSSGIASVKLVLYARLIGGDEYADSSINLVVINPYNKSWSETEAEGNLAPMTWAAYKVDHYSWQGLPGGILWEKPDNTPSEFFTYNTRFYQMSSLASKALSSTDEEDKNRYMYKSMELTLDFIADTSGKISSGIPTKRDIESANRCHEFAALYKLYLDSGFMNADANAAMLKWLYQESKYLYNGAGILYTGANAEVTSNNYANTNRGAWHIMGLLDSVAYFPEFAGSSQWESVLNERIEKVVNVLIGDDGCYLEPTFGYPGAVIGFFNAMLTAWENTGKEPVKTLESKLMLLGRYLMYTGYPDGNPPRWGENTGSARGTIRSIRNYSSDPELLYYVTNGQSGAEPASTYEYFDLLKVVTDRTGWTSSDSMIFMNAKNGGNHNHKDSLALTLYYGGKEIIEDTGMTSYDGGYPSFDWQRHQTRSHNTIEIDDTPQRGSNFLDDNGDSDINISSDKSSAFITAWTDATEGFRHKRNVLWFKEYGFAVVDDTVIPSDTESHKYTQNWHVYSKYSASPSIDGTFTGKTDYKSGTELIISQADKTNLTASLQKGYSAISSDMTDYFCYEKNTAGTAYFSTVLVPVGDGDEVTVESDVIPVTGNDSARAANIRYNKNGEELTVITYTCCDGEKTKADFGTMTTNGDSAYAVYSSGKVISAGMYGANILAERDVPIISCHETVGSVSYTVKDGVLSITCSDDGNGCGFTIGGCGEITYAEINGEPVEFSVFGENIYVNYGFSVNAEFGGAFQYGQLLWGYDSAAGILSIYGNGSVDAYTTYDYTDRPWQEYSDEIEYLVLDNGITSADMYTFSDLPLLRKVWCSGSFFDVSGNTYAINSKFAGQTEYICSSSTAASGAYEFEWRYTPSYENGNFLGKLNIAAKSEAAVLSSLTFGGWEHVDYDSLAICGADKILLSFENPCLKNLYITGTSVIGENAFADCPALSRVNIAEGLKHMYSGAFKLTSQSGGYIDINLPASLVNIENPFDGRAAEYIQLYGYPGTAGENFASDNSLRFEYITEGRQDGYTWRYNEDSGFLYIDIIGEIPSSLAESYDDIMTTYEPYASRAGILYLGSNVTSVADGIFDGGNIGTVYCPHDMFELTYEQAASVGDAIYIDENGNETVYPATVEIDGNVIPTHNADITAVIKQPFAGDADYKAANGTFIAYTKTSSPFTIAPDGIFEWSFNPETGVLTLDCISGSCLGNSSVRTRSYYPWRQVAAMVKAVDFKGAEFSSIGKYSLSGMALEELDIPDSIITVYMRAVQDCKQLMNVSFGEKLEKIYDYAFYNCKSLETIVLPDSLSFIGSMVFMGSDPEVICTVGTTAAKTDMYTDSNAANPVRKRILSKLDYSDGKIGILCGSDNTDKLIKAYYTYDKNGVPTLKKAVVDDIKLTKDTYLTLSDSLEDEECDFVKLMLAMGTDSICPDSKAVDIIK